MYPLKVPTGAWRAPGDNAQVFAAQSFMHELALAAGKDHVKFLIESVNMDVPDLAPKVATVNFSPKRASDVIQMCADKIGWGRDAASRAAASVLAWCYSHAGHTAQAIELSVDADKRIKVHHIVAVLDVGPIIDMNGSEAQAQGASTDALSTAMGLKLNIAKGAIQGDQLQRLSASAPALSRRCRSTPSSSSRTIRRPACGRTRLPGAGARTVQCHLRRQRHAGAQDATARSGLFAGRLSGFKS